MASVQHVEKPNEPWSHRRETVRDYVWSRVVDVRRCGDGLILDIEAGREGADHAFTIELDAWEMDKIRALFRAREG